MVKPSKMCRKHLLGEHLECHMFIGTFKKRKIDEYLVFNLLESMSVKKRHNELEDEMRRRGYRTNSQIIESEFRESLKYLENEPEAYLNNNKIDVEKSRYDFSKMQRMSRKDLE